MNKQFYIFILLLAFSFSNAQNLIPNGDFEQYIACPTLQGQSNYAVNFFALNPSIYATDYFNTCATNTGCDVPVNNLGYQQAYSGVAYSGIFIRQGFGANTKEYVEGQFSSSLVAGTCYHFEMYINLGDGSQYSTNDVAIYFSDTLVTGISNFNPLPFTPHITNQNGAHADSMNWTLVSGNYTATGGENYFIIGNFKNDALINQQLVNAAGNDWIYFYIDDVSLTVCTGIEELDTKVIKIFPNPFINELTVSIPMFPDKFHVTLTMFDAFGKEVLFEQLSKGNCKLKIANLSKGIYFYEVKNKNKRIKKGKLIKE